MATLDDETLGEIQRWDLDVLVKLDSRILPGAILDAARHGVWAYHYGSRAPIAAAHPCSGRSTTELQCQKARSCGSPAKERRS